MEEVMKEPALSRSTSRTLLAFSNSEIETALEDIYHFNIFFCPQL